MTRVYTQVFPARAGMIPTRGIVPGCSVRIPRESGDDPRGIHCLTKSRAYSPRERG